MRTDEGGSTNSEEHDLDDRMVARQGEGQQARVNPSSQTITYKELI